MDDSLLIQRWPIWRKMSPSSLKAFNQCHYRIRLQYVDGIKAPDKWIRTFAIGNAAHESLKTMAQQMKVDVPPVGEEFVRDLASRRLPISEYPSEEARQADIQLVVDCVDRGKRYLEKLKPVEWLLIESFEEREIPLLPARARYTLLSVPDLVVKRLDEDGNPYVHIIDYKTGKRRIDLEEEVPVIQRFILKDQLRTWIGDEAEVPVRFTWLWLEDGGADHRDVTVEHCNFLWPDILQTMEAMASETEWNATPGWYCRYCPYYGNYCKEEIPPDS